MKEKVCKNCKWWENRNCNNDIVNYDNDSGVGEFLFYLSCDSISTAPNFGCIHWKNKDEEIL